MFQRIFLFCGVIGGLLLSSCSSPKTTEYVNHTEAESKMEHTEEIEITETEDASVSMPFEVQIDKTALQIRKEKETTVIITSSVADWAFEVSAENGKISDMGKNSFTYTVPKDEDEREDTITIRLMDYENGALYRYKIPLIFSSHREVMPAAAKGNAL